MPKSVSAVSSTITSSSDAESCSPSPREAKPNSNRGPGPWSTQSISDDDQPKSPEFTSLPPFPSSPVDPPKHSREPSKGFFANMKASKSSNKIHHIEPTIRQVSEDIPRKNVDVSESAIYSMRKNVGSTPDLSLTTSLDDMSSDKGTQQTQSHKVPRRPVGASIASDSIIVTTPTETSQLKKPKPRLTGLLTRTRSIRTDEAGRKSKNSTPTGSAAPEIRLHHDGSEDGETYAVSPKTAPLRQDNAFRDVMGSATRNRSADRQSSSNHSQENMSLRRSERSVNQGPSSSSSIGSRDNAGSHLFTNIKNTSNKAAGGLGKASKTFFGKVSRSGSSTTREEERYVPTVINMPLVEQTRKTRIASRLADSRDKTEFWMPALPWRCIDYLNFKGCEEEGLYRVPGSEVQIRHWQKRFDQEGDINLFEEPELYDINIIGSLFKGWLRELPTEILPKEVQAEVASRCANAVECPQLLKDALSHLPPWNYYLLFAITCHLSLLIAYSDKNKMNFHNLCVCFQPCLRIDNFCFQFLVQDWRNCWQGCYTEKAHLDKEYAILDGRLPSSSNDDSSENDFVTKAPSMTSSSEQEEADESESKTLSNHHTTEGRSPSISNQTMPGARAQQVRPSPLAVADHGDDLSTIYSEAMSTPTGTGFRDKDLTAEYVSNHTPLPELAPVQPVSPIAHHFH
ncbi:hypothetical protein ACLMJK_005788 [Lecanora helva]